MYKSFIKPLGDRFLALLAIIILLPVFVVITVLLFIANRGKPFFTQARAGFKCEVFTLIKFKTMNDLKDVNGELLPDADRLTPVGNFVRGTSLDELPQLINVLKGDMSLIGPRPFLAEYLEIYTPEELGRFKVRPGITGWAQVNGRNAITWKQKFAYDLWYVEHCTFLLDFKIVILTIKNVLKGAGIAGKDQATAERYNGNN
ncbi:MAG: sugar transferase [Pedobacter sp.]|nr:MAG: sugar transferase [Pedobacter sp.]